MSKDRKVWRGDLARPIKLEKSPLDSVAIRTPESEAEHNEWRSQAGQIWADEANQKMKLLLDHYGIDQKDKNRWFQLSFNLAMDHVPGLRIEYSKKSGRPQKWRDIDLLLLYSDFEEKKAARKARNLPVKIRDVCGALIKDDQYNYKGKIKSIKTLGNLYLEAKRIEFVRNFFPIESGFEEEFQSLIKDIRSHQLR